MAYLKNGFHAGPTGHGVRKSFYETLDAAGIPFTAKATDRLMINAQEVAQKSAQENTVVFRRSVGNQGTHIYDVPKYDIPYKQAAAEHWELHKAEFPPELDPSITWVENINEPDKERANWLGGFSFETANIALAEGYRYLAFGWSLGEPEPYHWEEPLVLDYLRLCAKYPGRLGISLHEYSKTTENIWNGMAEDGSLWLVGRFTHLHAVCDKYNIAYPTIVISEWGWSYNDAPNVAKAMSDIYEVGLLYAQYPNIRAVNIWALNAGWGGIGDTVVGYIDPLLSLTLDTWYDVDVPPIDPTFFANPCFSDGWSTRPDGNQVPNDWTYEQGEVGAVLPNGSVCTRTPESVHKLNSELPPNEQIGGSDSLILCGDTVYKTFWVAGISGTRLENVISGLEPNAEYSLTGNFQVHYHSDVNEPDHLTIEIYAGTDRVKTNNPGLPDRTWVPITLKTKARQDGTIRYGLFVYNKFTTSEDIFMDGFSVVKEGEENLPKIVIVIKPQISQFSIEDNQWVGAWAYNTYGRTTTHSRDDMASMLASGNADSYAVVVNPSQQGGIVQWLEANGYAWQPLNTPNNVVQPPMVYRPSDTRQINRVFGTHPEDYPMFGQCGHEGIDLAVAMDWPFYATQDGIVVHASDRQWRNPQNQSNYGWHVVLSHNVGGQRFHSVYAHARADLPVSVGDEVVAGDVIALSGNTGNSTGYHLHYSILVDTPTGCHPDQLYGYYIDPEYVVALPSPRDGFPQTDVDMAVYFQPVGAYGDLFILTNNWGQNSERVQQQRSGVTTKIVKNSQWEQRLIDDSRVYLLMDTSPGDGQYYTVDSPDGWCPRFWNEGDTFSRSEYVQYFYKGDCSPVPNKPPYTSTSIVRFDKLHDTWTSGGGIVLRNVVGMSWIVNGVVEERYFYAPRLGLVAWKKSNGMQSWISELITQGNQSNNTPEIIDCL